MATTTTPEQDDSDWGKGYHELQSFVAAHGHARVPARHVTAAGFRLGAWVTRQRADHLGQQLGMPHAGKLEALSGWAWNKSDADWDAQYEKLSAYASEHEHAQPPIDYSTADGLALGRWVYDQRRNFSKQGLTDEQRTRLEEIEGWTWDVRQARWERGLEALIGYVTEHADSLVPIDHRAGAGYPLGSWVATQRRSYNQASLASDRLSRLEAIEGWTWGASSRPPPAPPGAMRRRSANEGTPTHHVARLRNRPVFDFVARIAAAHQAGTVLDPMCRDGVLLELVANAMQAGTVHGISDSPGQARHLLGKRAHVVEGRWQASSSTGESDYHLAMPNPDETLGRRYDLVVADTTQGGHGASIASDVAQWACAQLEPSGVAILVVPEAFVKGKTEAALAKAKPRLAARSKVKSKVKSSVGVLQGREGNWQRLIPQGFRIRALLHLGPTASSDYVAVVDQGDQEDMLIGQYAESPAHQDELIKNLVRGQQGQSIALGRLCAPGKFWGYEPFAALDRLERLAQGSKWSPRSFSEVVTQVHAVGPGIEPASSEFPGEHCYLDIGPETPVASLTLEELADQTNIDVVRTRTRVNRVVRLDLNPAATSPAFLVHWLNRSRIGRLTLDTLRDGDMVHGFTINQERLQEATLYLPPVAEQEHILDLDRHITLTRSNLDQVDADLWSGTKPLRRLMKDITATTRGSETDPVQDYEAWIEQLPYPLASILRLAHAQAGSLGDQNKILISFFETTAQFLGTIHLSAFRASPEVWDEYGSQLKERADKQGLTVQRPTAGYWNLVVEYLSAR